MSEEMNSCQPYKHNYCSLRFDILLGIRATIQSNKNSCAVQQPKTTQQKCTLHNSVFLKMQLNPFQCCKTAMTFFFSPPITLNQLHNLIRELLGFLLLWLSDTELGKKNCNNLKKISKRDFHFRHPSFRLSRLILNSVMLSDFSRQGVSWNFLSVR